MIESNIYQDIVKSFPPPVLPENAEPLKPELAAQIIINTVCEFYGVEFKDIDVPRKTEEMVIIRQQIMWYCKRFTKLSLKSIGKLFAKKYDHSTIIHGVVTWDDAILHYRRQRADHEKLFQIIKEKLS